MAHGDIPQTLEHEILDRPLSADGWTFSCCESVSDEGEDAVPAIEIEDEVLDRPLSADGWTFSCCESVSGDEAEEGTAVEIEDEVLDRPWQADSFYTICCTMGISPEEPARPARAAALDGESEILDRPLSTEAAYQFSGPHRCCGTTLRDEDTHETIEDEVLDRPWQVDGFATICCTMGISPEDEMLDRPNAVRFTAHSCTIAVAPEQVMPTMATAGVPVAHVDGDRMVDVMLRAGSAFGDAASH